MLVMMICLPTLTLCKTWNPRRKINRKTVPNLPTIPNEASDPPQGPTNPPPSVLLPTGILPILPSRRPTEAGVILIPTVAEVAETMTVLQELLLLLEERLLLLIPRLIDQEVEEGTVLPILLLKDQEVEEQMVRTVPLRDETKDLPAGVQERIHAKTLCVRHRDVPEELWILLPSRAKSLLLREIWVPKVVLLLLATSLTALLPDVMSSVSQLEKICWLPWQLHPRNGAGEEAASPDLPAVPVALLRCFHLFHSSSRIPHRPVTVVLRTIQTT